MRQRRGGDEQSGDEGKADRPAECADDVKRHTAAGALREKADNYLRQKPAEPQDGACCADSENVTGELIDETCDDGRRVHRRRTGLKSRSGAGNLPEYGAACRPAVARPVHPSSR